MILYYYCWRGGHEGNEVLRVMVRGTGKGRQGDLALGVRDNCWRDDPEDI